MELKNRDQMDPKYMWDLSHIYKDSEAFEAAFAEAESAIPSLAAVKGTLGESAQALKNGLDAVYALFQKFEPVYIYTMLRKSGDSSDPENLELNGRAMRLLVAANSIMSFLEPEILSIPEDKIREYLACPELDKYSFMIENILRGEWGFEDEFNTTNAEAIELTTFEGDPLYAMPVKVVANFDWSLSLPEWCKGEVVAEGAAAESLSGKAGQAVEILLAANLTAEVKDGASGLAKFIDATDNSKTIEIALTLPAFADRLEVSEPASLEFAADGSSERPAISYVLGMNGFVVRALGFNGEWHDTSYADWVTAEIENGNPESTEVLTLSAVHFSTAANTGKERVADIFIFPASMADLAADAICDMNSPTCAFLPEYEKYYVGRLTQAGKAAPYLSEYIDMMSGVETYEASLTTYEASQWWASMVGGLSVTNQYELNYWNASSELTLQFDSPFAEYKIFDYDFNEVTGAALDTFWIWFTNWSDKGKVMMDPAFFNNPDAEVPESFIVFYDASGKALAGICCKYIAAPSGGESSTPISVKSGSAEVSVGLSSMGLPEGTLNNIISGLGVGSAQTEMLIQASASVVEFTANFNIQQIFVVNPAGVMETPAGFSCYQSSYTDFRITAASGTECILLFMDTAGNIPVVAYYSFY